MSIKALGRRLAREESGALLVIAGLSMSVVLLLGAMAIDTGNWFTHKRQLQNRADAGALAAGVSYEKYWMGCVGPSGAVQTAAAANITQAAHQYGGDPTNGAPYGTPYNTEVADQSKVNVNVNQTNYNTGSLDGTDGGGPCFNHPANVNDDTTPQGGYWTDVKVNESNVPLFFSGFGITPPRITARARVEVRPAISASSEFIPLGVPVQTVVKARVAFYNQCKDPNETGAPLAVYDLQKLSGTLNGNELWGNPNGGGANQTLSLPIPTMTGCGGDYVPIGVQIRVGGTPTSNLATCTNAQFTGCFKDLSEIRGWPNSDPTTGPPLFGDVKLTGNGTTACSPDAYFSRTANCTTGVAVNVDWGDRDDGNKNDSSKFTVSVNGKQLTAPGPNTPSGVWTRTQNDVPLGASGTAPLTISWTWNDQTAGHVWRTKACNTNNNCKASGGPIDAHQGFVADDTNAGVVQLVKTTSSVNVDPAAGPVVPIDSLCITGGSAACTSPPGASMNVYFTVGLQSGFTPGTFAALRLGNTPQGSQLLDCNDGNNGHEIQQFANGCDYYYGVNDFSNGTWWNTATQSCPSANSMNGITNTASSPWRCVAVEPGGHGFQPADGVAIRTKNCTNIKNNGCGSTSCLHASHYTAYANGTLPVDPNDPRIVDVFIVPYGTFTGVNGNDTIPVLDFASFYITGWNGDPCPVGPNGDESPGTADIVGRFIANVGPATGPTDPNAVCTATQVRPCRVTLVR